MQINGWKYYNHAAIPTTAPHEDVNTTPITNCDIWKLDGKPLLVRWSSDWDCKEKTNWWHVIKDGEFDISKLPSKKRYEITKGLKNFNISIINPTEYRHELFEVTAKAFESWPLKYRPKVNRKSFFEMVDSWGEKIIYGAFCVDDSKLCGYACISRESGYTEFSTLRVIPEYEKKGINAALVYQVTVDNIGYGYIHDGARNIRHETAFQDYLEKYFGYRKAYCRLHIKYKPIVGLLVMVLYPFRAIMPSPISGILRMEELFRNQYE